jgi:hypothetical protein
MGTAVCNIKENTATGFVELDCKSLSIIVTTSFLSICLWEIVFSEFVASRQFEHKLVQITYYMVELGDQYKVVFA